MHAGLAVLLLRSSCALLAPSPIPGRLLVSPESLHSGLVKFGAAQDGACMQKRLEPSWILHFTMDSLLELCEAT